MEDTCRDKFKRDSANQRLNLSRGFITHAYYSMKNPLYVNRISIASLRVHMHTQVLREKKKKKKKKKNFCWRPKSITAFFHSYRLNTTYTREDIQTAWRQAVHNTGCKNIQKTKTKKAGAPIHTSCILLFLHLLVFKVFLCHAEQGNSRFFKYRDTKSHNVGCMFTMSCMKYSSFHFLNKNSVKTTIQWTHSRNEAQNYSILASKGAPTL